MLHTHSFGSIRCVCVCVCECIRALHLSQPPPLPPPSHLLLYLPTITNPSLPQRKPAIQTGLEIKSLGVWPGPRHLAGEVGERQPKPLPLGLYCLYRGLVIGSYGTGTKRLLPQPLRRVRISLPPSLSYLSPPHLHPPTITAFFFGKKRKEEKKASVRTGSAPRLSPSSSPRPFPSVSARCLPTCACVCLGV